MSPSSAARRTFWSRWSALISGGSDVVGIYRVDGPHSFTVIADIGQFALDNPPSTAFDVPTGLQYSLEPYQGGFLVADGHHNRVLRVTLDGRVSEMLQFGNIVPTGLATAGQLVYLALAGPVPHLPSEGRIVAFGARSATATDVAAGAPLLVDVEFGRGRRLYALSQGVFQDGPPAAPASPDTGALVEVNDDGTMDGRGRRARPSDVRRVHRRHGLHRHIDGRDSGDLRTCSPPPFGRRP